MQSGIPDAVRDCLQKWKSDVGLNEDAKRVLMLHTQCADKSPHIWFYPPAPEEIEYIPWFSFLLYLYQNVHD